MKSRGRFVVNFDGFKLLGILFRLGAAVMVIVAFVWFLLGAINAT